MPILTEAQQLHLAQQQRIDRLHRNPEQLARIVKAHRKDCALADSLLKRGRRIRRKAAVSAERAASRAAFAKVVKPAFEADSILGVDPYAVRRGGYTGPGSKWHNRMVAAGRK